MTTGIMNKSRHMRMVEAAQSGGADMYKAFAANRGGDEMPFFERLDTDIAETPSQVLDGKLLGSMRMVQDLHMQRRQEREDEDGSIDVSPKAEAGDQAHITKEDKDLAEKGYIAKGYSSELTQKKIESIIKEESKLRNIDPDVAIKIYKAEGLHNYQSQISKGNQKMEGGTEASYGPFQLYTGGGLGNEYEEATGRTLRTDNTVEGVRMQIQFSLDKAVEKGWSPWKGRKSAGVKSRDGLDGAIVVDNWRQE